MADEDTEQVIEESPEAPTDLDNVEETEEEPEQAEEAAEEPVPDPEPEHKPSRRESLRIQQLVSKLKQQTPAPRQTPQGLDYGRELNADPETIKQLEADRRKYADQAYSQGIKQANSIQFHTRLEIDAPRMEAKYPVLDKHSNQFNPAVADAINTMYLSTAGYDSETDSVQNANVRYADYVESLFELVNAAAGEKAARATKNIAKQAASTGLRPDGSTPKRLNLNQAPQNMSDEELDAIIAQAVPKKR